MSPRAGLDTEAVVEAAAALVDELGVEHLSLALLAQRLGVRKPSLYNHIASLPELKYLVVVQSKRAILASLTQALEGTSGLEAIFALAEAYRAYIKAHPGLYSLGSQTHMTEPKEEYLAVERDIFACVQAAVAPYRLSEDEMNNAILGVRSIIEGFLSLEMGGDVSPVQDLDQRFRWVINVFVHGLVMEKPALEAGQD